jgi:hypothetical protein
MRFIFIPIVHLLIGQFFFLIYILEDKMTKHYLYCKFEEKEKLKELGGKWDADVKKWYCDTMTEKLKEYREVNVTVPYDQKDSYKEKYSIRWSPDCKSWVTSQKIAELIESEN